MSTLVGFGILGVILVIGMLGNYMLKDEENTHNHNN